MTKSLLHEYVQQIVLNEGISFNKLKSMSFEEVKQYANTHLQTVGVGSSRKAYRLNSRFVLKLGIVRYNRDEEDVPHTGIAQNKREFEARHDAPDLLPIVHEHADDFSWIISDLVRPLKNKEEFCHLAGVNVPEWMKASDVMSAIVGWKPSIHLRDKFKINPQLTSQIDKIRQSTNLSSEELENIEQWGKSANGRLVLLDNGFDSEIHNNHYR